jgi:O-antigen/teichoic acid export membrane protein
MFGQAILLVLSLVSTRFVFKELGPDVLGIIYFSITVTFLMITLSDMGLSGVVTREIAAHRHSDDRYVSELIGTTSVLAWAAYGVSILLIVLLAPLLIKHWLRIESIDHNEAVIAFVAISASLLLAIPRGVYGAIIAGNERMDVWNTVNVFAIGLQQLGMILVLGVGGSLYDVAVWYVISGIAGIVMFGTMAARLSGISPLRLSYRWAVIRQNLHFGSRVFAISMVGYFIGQADKWIVSKLLPASQLGYYSVAQSLVSKGAMVPGAIAQAAFPALSTDVANKERHHWMTQYHKLQDFCSYIYIPVSAAVAMLGIVVMSFVLNEDVVRQIWPTLVFLALGQLLQGLQYVPYILSLAMKRPEIMLRAYLWTMVIAIPIAILLTMRFGLAGAAFSTIIANALNMFYFIPRFSTECLKTSGWKWFRMSGLLTVLGLLSYGLPWLALWIMGLGLDAYGLVAAYAFGSVLFLLVGWIAAGPELKDLVRGQLRSFGIKVSAKAPWPPSPPNPL